MKNIRMIKAAITLLALSTLGLANAQAQLLVDFDLNGYTNQNPYTTPISTSAYGSTDANIGNSSILFGAGATAATAANTGGRQLAAGFDGVDVAAAITNQDYLSFNIDATSGFQFTVTGIDFENRGNNGSNDFSAAVRSSVDSFASNLATFTIEQDTLKTDNLSISGVTDQTSVEFRIYVWGASAAGDDFQFRDLDIAGTTSVIPEPSTAGLLCAAMGLVLLVRRRRLC